MCGKNFELFTKVVMPNVNLLIRSLAGTAVITDFSWAFLLYKALFILHRRFLELRVNYTQHLVRSVKQPCHFSHSRG